MAMTNNEELATRMRRLRSHGIDSNRHINGSWTYELTELGYNFRLTDMQAALGLSQLKDVNKFVDRREELALTYNRLLEGLPLQLPLIKNNCSSAWHLYVVNLLQISNPDTRTRIFSSMREEDIGVNVHYMPLYRQPYYRDLYGINENCPNAEKFYESALTLPLHPALSDDEQHKVVNVLKALLKD